MKMDIRNFIDNAILKPFFTEKEVESFVKESERLGIYAVCVNPFHVKLAKACSEGKIKICSVVGFPLGLNKTPIKVKEAVCAVEDGAEELDIVINISAFKSGNFNYVERELKEIFRETPKVVHKVIIETAYLTEKEKDEAVRICIDTGADFVKTSTGFAPKGATPEDVKFLKKAGKGKIKVKASGGIKDLKTALAMIEAGADRIGTSNGIEIVKESLSSYIFS